MATEREIQFRKSWDSRVFPALDFDNIHEYPNRYVRDDQSPKFHGSRDEAARHVKSFIEYASKLNIKHEDLLMKSFHDSLQDRAKSWVTIYAKRKSFSSLSSFISSFRMNWDPTFDHEGDPFTFEDDHSNEDYLMPLDDQNTSLEPSEESMQEKTESHLYHEEPMVTISPSLQINESISLCEIPLNEVSLNPLEDVYKEIPQVIVEELPLELPDCPHSLEIEICEPNTLSFEDVEMENLNPLDPFVSYLDSTFSPISDHFQNIVTGEICIGQDLSFHPSHPSSPSDFFISLNSYPYLEDYIHPIDAWVEDACTCHYLPWYLFLITSYESCFDFEVSFPLSFTEHNVRFINLLLKWLHYLFDFT